MYTLADRLFADHEAAGAQCRQRGCRIWLRDLRQRQVVQRPLRVAKAPAVVLNLILPVNAAAQQLCALFVRHVSNGVRHVRLAHHGRFICPENTGLLAANAFTIGPQPVDMIQRDAGHYRHVCIDDIGRIKTSAKTNLKDHHVQLGLFEQPQGRQSAVFKIG